MAITAKAYLYRQLVPFRGKKTTRAAMVKTLLSEGFKLSVVQTQEDVSRMVNANLRRRTELLHELRKGEEAYPLCTRTVRFALFLLGMPQ